MSVVTVDDRNQHIGIPTSDIETTIRFYEGLGFQTMHTNQVPANQAKSYFFAAGEPDDRDLRRRWQRHWRRNQSLRFKLHRYSGCLCMDL